MQIVNTALTKAISVCMLAAFTSNRIETLKLKQINFEDGEKRSNKFVMIRVLNQIPITLVSVFFNQIQNKIPRNHKSGACNDVIIALVKEVFLFYLKIELV